MDVLLREHILGQTKIRINVFESTRIVCQWYSSRIFRKGWENKRSIYSVFFFLYIFDIRCLDYTYCISCSNRFSNIWKCMIKKKKYELKTFPVKFFFTLSIFCHFPSTKFLPVRNLSWCSKVLVQYSDPFWV